MDKNLLCGTADFIPKSVPREDGQLEPLELVKVDLAIAVYSTNSQFGRPQLHRSPRKWRPGPADPNSTGSTLVKLRILYQTLVLSVAVESRLSQL